MSGPHKRNTDRRAVIRKRLRYMMLVVVFASSPHGISHGQAMTPGLIRQILLDPQHDPATRDWTQPSPWDALAQLPGEEQVSLLREVVEMGPDQSAMLAANRLILIQAVDCAELIAARLHEWPDGIGLKEIAYTEQATAFAIIARQTLRRQMDQQLPYQLDLQTRHGTTVRALGAIDRAATLLGQSGQPEDLAVLRDAAVAFPDSPEVWIALASHPSSLEAAQQALAMERFNNLDLSQELRAAAAAALAPTNSDAAAVVEQIIASVLEEYESLDPSAAVMRMSQGMVDDEASRVYKFMFSDHRILAMLRVLSTPHAQDLATRSLDAENPDVRTLGAVIMAARWPDYLINDADTRLTPNERNGAIALIGRFHPDMTQSARSAATDTEAFDALQRTLQGSELLSALGPSGIAPGYMRYMGLE